MISYTKQLFGNILRNYVAQIQNKSVLIHDMGMGLIVHE